MRPTLGGVFFLGSDFSVPPHVVPLGTERKAPVIYVIRLVTFRGRVMIHNIRFVAYGDLVLVQSRPNKRRGHLRPGCAVSSDHGFRRKHASGKVC